MMQSKLLKQSLVLSLICFFGLVANAGADHLTNFILHPPVTPAHAQYLGVPQNEQLHIADIDADYLLVEIFSMYCPYCQAEARHVNVLYDMIKQNHPDKLKIIGIGAGNTAFEVDYFRKKYNIEFPLFSDSDYVIHKQIGQVGTPFFYLLKKEKDGQMQVLMTQEGPYRDTKTFYKRIIEKAGL